ncbi:MAG: metallophosphoesterase [Clostridia bacterium]|nr:metallophosphoesterase [Clostridia bacterium]
MKKIVSLIVIFAMICTLCPAFPLSAVMTASAANQTYYYGFEDNKLPSDMKLTYCSNAAYTNGILSFTPGDVDSSKNSADPMITISGSFSGDEVNQIRIRMYHNLKERTDKVHNLQVYYAGTASNGSAFAISEGRSIKKAIELSSGGDYITYTIDMSNATYWAGGTITQIRIDPVSCATVDGDTVKIDYIMLCKKADELDPIISYEFETDGDYEGIVPKLQSQIRDGNPGFSVANGCLNYEYTSYEDVNLILPSQEITTDQYEYVEIIMKHDISASGVTSDTIRMYMKGTFGDGSELKWNENNAIKPAITQTSNGEFKRYVLTFDKTNGGTSLAGATINSIRIDPVNSKGTFSIDSIRIVPHYVQYEPLDVESTTLSYTFANNDAGCGMGTIKIDFGRQNPLFAKNVELMWASGNATDGYTALADYTSITTKTGSEMSKGYVISRPLYIPEGTTALIARVTDVEKTFDLVADIPSTKVLTKTTPKFTAALASDFHFGDYAVAKTAPAQKYYDLQTHVQANADTLLVVGDIVQWYGVKDMNEYYHLEYLSSGGTKYTDYAEYDPTALPSQWDMAMDYFQSWDIPVFIIEGNHETPSAGRMAQGHTGKYMKDWMTEWVNYTNNRSMYDEFTERDKYIYDNTYEYATYYDNYVTGDDGTKYHVIGMRNLHMGNTKLSDQELQWLDKKLYESEATGTPTFLMIHVPLYGNFTSSTTFNDANFKAVVDKHPNTVIVSGHTHYSLYSDYQLAINGAGDAPSWLHDGAVVDTGIHYPESGTDGAYSKSNCELVYAEVYEDRIVTRAYDVIKGKYIATNTNQITLKDETTIGDISVTKTAADGNVTLTASCATEGVTYQWYVGGEAAGSGASVTLPDACTDFVAVRVTDASGSFRSESFDSVYDDRIVDEVRTYGLVLSDSEHETKMYNDFSSKGLATEWVNVAGKSDNVLHMTFNGDATERTYIRNKTYWTQQNPDSKYLVLKLNAMPLTDDTLVYLATNTSANLSARKSMIPYEWNNLVTVVTLDSAKNFPTATYLNGKLVANETSKNFGNNTDTAKNGIIRLMIATESSSVTVTDLEAYIDDFEVYETVNAPVIAPLCDMSQPEVSGTNVYSAENRLAYVPAGTTTNTLSQAYWCVVVDANGATKAADAAITDTDMLMYFDPVSGSYNYYSVKTYTDYSTLFVSGADDGIFTASDVRLYVNTKAAGETVVVAQYEEDNDLVKAEYTVCEEAGLNELTFTKASETSYASVFVWDSMSTIKPLAEETDILVK